MYSPEDRTAKAIIRDAAIELFGRDGFDVVPLRAIATQAGVSQPLIIKHFDSRNGLLEATDEHVLNIAERLLRGIVIESNGESHSEAAGISVARLLGDSAIGPYLARMLTMDDDRARQAFERLAEFARTLIDQLADTGRVAQEIDRHHLSVVLLVHDLSALVLRARIAETLGADPLDPGGLELWSHTVKALYSGKALVDPGAP